MLMLSDSSRLISLDHKIVSCLQVSDGEVGHQMRVAVNAMNSYSEAADKKWASSMGFSAGRTNAHIKEPDQMRQFEVLNLVWL
jgi:hypothetical protein